MGGSGGTWSGPVMPAPLPRTTWLPSDLGGVLSLLRKYWLLLVSFIAAGILAMLVVAIVVVGPSYLVSAKVLVNLGPEMVATPLLRASEAGTPMPTTRRPEDSATGVEIFSDPGLIRRVVAELGDDYFADDPPTTLFQQIKHGVKAVMRGVQDAIRGAMVAVGLRPPTTLQERLTLAIGAALRVEPVRRTDIISVSLRFPAPRAGEHILERFIALALANHLRAYRSPGVTSFFRDGRTTRREELRAAEDRLLELRLAANDPVWSVAEQRPVLIRAEAEAQLQLRLLRAAIDANEAEAAQAEATLARLPAEIELSTLRSRNPATVALRSRLVQLQLDLVMQQARYGEDSQEITDIRRQMDALLVQIGAEAPFVVEQVTMGINPMSQAVARDLLAKRTELEGQHSSAGRLESQIEALRGQLRRIETAAIEIGQLELDVVRLRRAVETYERGFEEARLAEAIEAVQLSGLRVVMPPVAEILPSSPSLRRILLLGLAGGLTLAVALILILEYRALPKPPVSRLPADEDGVPNATTEEPLRVETHRQVA